MSVRTETRAPMKNSSGKNSDTNPDVQVPCASALNSRVRKHSRETPVEVDVLYLAPDVMSTVVSETSNGVQRGENGASDEHKYVGWNTELHAFAQTIAHDLREPLRTISAFTQLLVRKAQLRDDEKQIAACIVTGVQ